ncbi:MAG: hypothetical protein IPH78_15440 [Bacteroidetes bacterium]|nr:hypothetical protein [Bacteroidota bacterium]
MNWTCSGWDSLYNFSGDIINLKGKLASGGIFQDIRDSVKYRRMVRLGSNLKHQKMDTIFMGGKKVLWQI